MATRYVGKTGKDKDGDITKLCNPGEPWSPRLKADAIDDIQQNIHQYKVSWTDGKTTDIKVVKGPTGLYLRTDHDSTTRNNLDDLPDC